METNLIVSLSPHMRSGASTQKIMLDVIIALTPAAIASCVIFGWSALLLIVLLCGDLCAQRIYLPQGHETGKYHL